METAAATAPVAPAISTVLVSVVVAATPKIKPKMETVPSSIPKTMVPAEFLNELRSRCNIEPNFIREPPSTTTWYEVLDASKSISRRHYDCSSVQNARHSSPILVSSMEVVTRRQAPRPCPHDSPDASSPWSVRQP